MCECYSFFSTCCGMSCNPPHVKDTRRCLMVPGKQGSPKFCTLASTLQFVLPWHFLDTLLKADGDKHSERKIQEQNRHNKWDSLACLDLGFLHLDFALTEFVMEIFSVAKALLMYNICSLDGTTELLFRLIPISGFLCVPWGHTGESCSRWPKVAE